MPFRSRLSYEQFSAFLANIKELNAQKQTREVMNYFVEYVAWFLFIELIEVSKFMLSRKLYEKLRIYLGQIIKIFIYCFKDCLTAMYTRISPVEVVKYLVCISGGWKFWMCVTVSKYCFSFAHFFSCEGFGLHFFYWHKSQKIGKKNTSKIFFL